MGLMLQHQWHPPYSGPAHVAKKLLYGIMTSHNAMVLNYCNDNERLALQI